jgi:hypothetical protein
MEASLPFDPRWSKQWIETKLKKNYFKKPYDRFMWWRSYTPKNKPLGSKASLIDRLINGDFDPGPYLLEVELVYHTMNEKFKELICSDGQVDFGKYTAETSIDRARKKRLEEDHEKEELRKLTDLRNLFKKQFRLSDDEYENEITKGSDTLVDFYYKLDDKYSKRNIRK